MPVEVKSGKDYTIHSALNTFVKNEDYHVKNHFQANESGFSLLDIWLLLYIAVIIIINTSIYVIVYFI